MVNFYILIDFKNPIDVAVDFVIVDPPELMVDANSGAVYSLTAPAPRPTAHSDKPRRKLEGH